MKRLLDQLEKDNYAVVDDGNTLRLFSRQAHPYKSTGSIFIAKGTKHKVVVIKPLMKLDRTGPFSFRLKSK